MEKIEYYFDFLSPYSYLSWQWVREQDYYFDYYPVVLGRVIHHYDTKGPAEIAPKREYLFKDCLRYAFLKQIPFEVPYRLPFNSLELLRIALKEVAQEQQKEVIDIIFRATWGRPVDVEDSNVVQELLDNHGLDGAGLIEKAASVEARKALKLNQKRAVERKLFGLPSFLVRNELFWGNDSIPHIKRFMAGEDHYDSRVWKQFFEIGNFEEEK